MKIEIKEKETVNLNEPPISDCCDAKILGNDNEVALICSKCNQECNKPK